MVFTVTLSETSSTSVTVEYATSNGSAISGADYTATSGTLTIGTGDTTGTITVPTASDSTDEPNEDFTMTLSDRHGHRHHHRRRPRAEREHRRRLGRRG